MEEKMELRQYWEVIRKRWLILIALPLIAALTSGIISFYILKPVYQASTTLIVGKKAEDISQALMGQILDYNVLQANLQLAKTYGEIAKSRTVEQSVIEKLDLQMTVAELDKQVLINPVKNTEILEIQVNNTNRQLAAAIANAMAEEFSAAVIEIKKVDSVSIVDEALAPIQPVKPNKMQNILIAFLVGLMAAVGLAFLLEYLDNTIKTSDEAENILGIPVLGLIPLYDTEKQANEKKA
ncbi:MAG TPA: Wzz/FepE/Etk N-terminal domain-containing protein [Desulfitobacteriaceae bacterium]|nr:Wzz/FepE/Etk N-terminal domain-containing protein [Desulfitobacteriaceae bacterium]